MIRKGIEILKRLIFSEGLNAKSFYTISRVLKNTQTSSTLLKTFQLKVSKFTHEFGSQGESGLILTKIANI
jgi:hypothetical protein